MSTFPFYKQPDAMDCGPTCLRMISKYYGRTVSLQKLRTLSETTTREVSSLHYLSTTTEQLGFRTLGVKINFQKVQLFIGLLAMSLLQLIHPFLGLLIISRYLLIWLF